MNRLTVRLSIVGAVLALSGAAIAHRVLSRGDATTLPGDTGSPNLAAAPTTEPPAPIRAEDETPEASPQPGSLPPPPASAFATSEPLRTVSHENEAAGGSEDVAPAVTADPIPMPGGSESLQPAYSEYDPSSSSMPQPVAVAGLSADDGGRDSAISPDALPPADPLMHTADAAPSEKPAQDEGIDHGRPWTPAASTAWAPRLAGQRCR